MGVKGTFKTIGDLCVRCHNVLTEETAVPRSKPRLGVLSNCRPCGNARAVERHLLNPEKSKQRSRVYKRRLRTEVLTAMGGTCLCCGETTQEFLCIDHINGGGRHERRLLKSSASIYLSIKRRGYPPEYQVLCHNCNAAKAIYGECPHKRQTK